MYYCLRCGTNNQLDKCSKCNRILDNDTLEEIKSYYDKLKPYFKLDPYYLQIDIRQINKALTKEELKFLYLEYTNIFEKVQEIKVSWDEVIFEDKQIKVQLSENKELGVKFLIYKFDKSRKNLNLSKTIFKERFTEKLKVLYRIKTHWVEEIENFEKYFNEILKIAEPSNFQVNNFSSTIKNVQFIKSHNWRDLLRTVNFGLKQNYFDYLNRFKCSKTKIIAVQEFNPDNDSFLYTLSSKNNLFNIIIWESVAIGTATHIFICNPSEYEQVIQNVEIYLTERGAYKRKRLRNSISSEIESDIVLKEKLKYKCFIHHELVDFNRWRNAFVKELRIYTGLRIYDFKA